MRSQGLTDSTIAYGPAVARVQISRLAAGRVCEHDGCRTVLSVYNRNSQCWVHEQPIRRTALYGGT